MKNLLFVVMLWSTIVGALPSLGQENCTNAIVKWCGTVQNSDYLEIITRGHEHNREIARAHARLAEGDLRYIRYAISVQGRMPSIDNLGFLYTFTNSPQYAAQAASSIIRILGITSDSLRIADHVISMRAVLGRDKREVCRTIAEMAERSNILLDDRLYIRHLLRCYEACVAGSARFADEISLNDPIVAQSGKKDSRSDNSELDKKIKDAFLVASDQSFCGDTPSQAYTYALKLCGEDNRRRSRIVVQIAREHPERVPWVLSELAVCGSAEDVPFINEWTNDVQCVANAAHALICIEGVTDSAIACANAAMSNEDMRTGKRYALCSAITRMANKAQVDESRKALAVSTLKQYSRTIPVTSLWADEFLLSLDPSYETSDDRKALLREVAARRVNDYQIDYATNALKRIDAKIQAERKDD